MTQNWDTLLKPKESRDAFCRWFWTGNNGNDLIKDLNEMSLSLPSPKGGRDFISRENESGRSYIYGVLLKHWKIHDADKAIMNDWRFIKIGLTQVKTGEGYNNRMEAIVKQIQSKYHGANVATTLFCLPINATDTKKPTEVEKEVRSCFGILVDKKSAEKMKLPVPTEWVITTQPHIDKFIGIKKAATESRKANTDVIINNKHELKKSELPKGLKMQKENAVIDGDTQFLFKETSFKK